MASVEKKISAKGARWFKISQDSRTWEDFYRNRWAHDRSVRTSHGVNCSGSCSWEVFVKDGLICWELQQTDYPQIDPDTPNYEPRGCQRGMSASWYPYSPLRPKYPYIRGVLLDYYRAERNRGKDAVEAWKAIVEDPARSKKYKAARGKAGWRRVSWDEATELVAAAQIYTIKKFGPDRLAAFSPIPAMSIVSFISGQRLNALQGGVSLSFYEWYHDLPHNSPMMWGDQTDVHESADWYQSTYWIVIGSNLPMTRTADAHFASEFKYRGGKLVNIAPNYSDVTKFSDLWVPIRPGTDAAYLMACIHVILKEFYAERKVPYFTNYAKQHTNLPFLVILNKDGDRYRAGRFLRASDVTEYSGQENAEWKPLLIDSSSGKLQVPNGTIGFRWEKELTGKWNLELKDSVTGKEIDPVLTFIEGEDQKVQVAFDDFTDTFNVELGKTDRKDRKAVELLRGVPAKVVKTTDGEVLVTTAFDLLMAHVGVPRGLEGDYPADYDDPKPFTPAWQESQTGVSGELAIRVGREFAENAEKTKGKSLFITGPGVLHWYHGGPLGYRAEAVMGVICGCMGRNGGGFAHYVGTEKIRMYGAAGTLANALDWQKPPRLMNSTSYWYFHTDQWRYDGMPLDPLWSAGAKKLPAHNHAADMNAVAVRLGWLPFYPQFDKKNSIQIVEEARKAGAKTDAEIVQYAVQQIEGGKLNFAIEDIDAPENSPKVLMVWRGNLIGTSMRGHEYALKHLLGTHHNVLGRERAQGLVKEIKWRNDAPLGKLDLLVNMNFRMDSSANYSDVVLPAAFWYEKYDLTCGDMHTFVHPFTPAHDPPWETKHDWDGFKQIAKKFSELAKKYFPKPFKEIVTTAIMNDTPDELAQPLGEIKDWRAGETTAIPGKTMPNIRVVERDYTKVYERYVSFGDEVCKPNGYGAKGIMGDLTPVYEKLKENHFIGQRNGLPSMEKPQEVAELVLRISPETDGEVNQILFKSLEKKVGLKLHDLTEGEADIHHKFQDLISQPRRTLTSPHWSAIETPGRTYSPWTLNVDRLKPWHTLTGRQEIYYDHSAYGELGEGLPTYKPPLDMVVLGDINLDEAEPKSKVFRFLTPHGKWQIHSSFRDTWQMTNLFRGGPLVWINDDDATEIDVKDNDWVELYCENGIQVCRAVVSHTVPRDIAIVYHQVERHLNVPFSKLAQKRGASDLRGGNNNATTRILMNPSTMIGGYAQFTYFINYWGTSPSERDHGVLIRKMPLEKGKKKVIYQERELLGVT